MATKREDDRVTHYRKTGMRTKCGLIGTDAKRTTRNRAKVSCWNCIRAMRLRVENLEEDVLTTERAEYQLKSLLRKQRISELEAEVANLKAEVDAAETMAEKWHSFAERIQNLAAEGKDPLSGEEPEFWFVVVVGLSEEQDKAYRATGEDQGFFTREEAHQRAEECAAECLGKRVYVLPAFDYAICEVSPVTWKRKSSEKALEADDDTPF